MKNIRWKKRNVAVFFWANNAYNAVVWTDGEYWMCFDSFDGIDLYAENAVDNIRHYISSTDFNRFDDLYYQYSADISGNLPVCGKNFSAEFPRHELEFVGMIYE